MVAAFQVHSVMSVGAGDRDFHHFGTVALRQRMMLSVVPFIAAGAVVCVVVMAKIATAGDIAFLIDSDGTLNYPFGYRNANAGFFAMVARPRFNAASASTIFCSN